MNKNTQTYNRRKEDGYSLVESMVAIVVMLTAIVAPLYIAYQGVRLAAHARDQVAATFLAQDGLEFVRAHIESNLLNGNHIIEGWELTDATPCADANHVCQMDTYSGVVSACNSATCSSNLKLDPATGLYRQDSNVAFVSTNLKRQFHMNEVLVDEEYEIYVEVFYGQGAERTSVVLRQLISEWRTEF